MPRRERQPWSAGGVFAVPLIDGDMAVGQVLDAPLSNVVSCSFYDWKLPNAAACRSAELEPQRLISLIWTTPDLLHIGKWLVVRRAPIAVPREEWPNEQFRECNWVGAATFGSGNVEKFLDAFHRLRAWDDWHDPNYLDRMLVSPAAKPEALLYLRE